LWRLQEKRVGQIGASDQQEGEEKDQRPSGFALPLSSSAEILDGFHVVKARVPFFW
jgi:hypothetical protein